MNNVSLDDAAEFVYEKLKAVGGDPLRLPVELQPIAILYHVQGMIDNGGFRYLFEGDFPFSPPYSTFVNAYRQIGADDTADKLEKAVALFPIRNPHLDCDGRNHFMDSIDESHEIFVLGDQVCGDERIWQLLEEYVAKNQALFRERSPYVN